MVGKTCAPGQCWRLPLHPSQLVSKDVISRYEELSTLMTQDDNYVRYRSELGTLAPDVFCVPFIGVFPAILFAYLGQAEAVTSLRQ